MFVGDELLRPQGPKSIEDVAQPFDLFLGLIFHGRYLFSHLRLGLLRDLLFNDSRGRAVGIIGGLSPVGRRRFRLGDFLGFPGLRFLRADLLGHHFFEFRG